MHWFVSFLSLSTVTSSSSCCALSRTATENNFGTNASDRQNNQILTFSSYCAWATSSGGVHFILQSLLLHINNWNIAKNTKIISDKTMRILGIPSALSTKAVSQALLRYGHQALGNVSEKFSKTLKSKPSMEIADIGSLPFFDGEKYKHEITFPSEVLLFREKLEKAEAVLFSCRENEHKYNIQTRLSM